MKTLFSRILIAQVVTVVFALAVITVITRYSLDQGFKNFLERQESAVLKNVAPVLIATYQRRGSWDFLRDQPESWQWIWRSSRGGQGERDASRGPGAGRFSEPPPALQDHDEEPLLRWMRPPDRALLRDRLFLLGPDRHPIAGPVANDPEQWMLEPLELDGAVIGWIGFTPLGKALPPDAERFLNRQLRLTAFALLATLLVAAFLAYLLARKVSRPVRELGGTIRRLSDGDYEARAPAAVHDEIGRLAAHVNRLAETLEKNRTARRRWMADIAHELRTPLAVLKGEVEALADGVRQADDRMAASLAEEIEHLALLVDDLQALALADAGALELRRESIDLTSLVRQTAEAFEQRFASRGISFEVSAAPGTRVAGDPHRLRQLLHNLLENSFRYAEQDGTVTLMLSATGQAELVLDDTGPGVSDGQLERLFERFFRVEESRSRATGGTGLGLSICRNIAEAHGGDIGASHSPSGGLRITVHLPLESS
jgi:two-component system sensor histidine kinase BaeS